MSEVLDKELVSIPPENALAVFTTAGSIDPILARIRQEIDAFRGDVSTAGGRKAIASMAHKVSQSKALLEKVGKDLADRQKEIPKKIDATRRHITQTLEKWRDEVRQPLTDWETRENDRVSAHQAAIDHLLMLSEATTASPGSVLREQLAHVQSVVIDDSCEEFAAEYAKAAAAAAKHLVAVIAERDRIEAEQAELLELRARQAKADAAEREERIRKEAAEREERIRKEAAEAAVREAVAKAEAERIAAQQREEALHRQVREAEQRAIERIERAKKEQAEAERRETEAKAAREADDKHRQAINGQIISAFAANGIQTGIAEVIISLIASGEVPHVTINY